MCNVTVSRMPHANGQSNCNALNEQLLGCDLLSLQAHQHSLPADDLHDIGSSWQAGLFSCLGFEPSAACSDGFRALPRSKSS